MVTRVSKTRTGNPPESCSVDENAEVRPTNASSVRGSRNLRGRQAGSGAKRAQVDGCSSPFPRGASGAANPAPSSPAMAKAVRPLPQPRVFVLDKKKRPLMPCAPRRAHELLDAGRAVVHRIVPFTIRLKDRIGGDTQPIRVCIDPGSRTTGIAVAREADADSAATSHDSEGRSRHVLWVAELTHRGGSVRDALASRSGYRRRRRCSNLRHRERRFSNRRSTKGTLRPSLRHRVETVASWVSRLRRWVPATCIAMELAKFDTQAMNDPSIGGTEYQHGTLRGYEAREYLLEKWRRQCAYCDAGNVPLQVEHVHPRSRGGSWRVGNLTLACEPCNQRKGTQLVQSFLSGDPKRLARILSTLTRPMADAAAMNATRQFLVRTVIATGLPVETGSGGRTKWNRTRIGIVKTHAADAVCVGRVSSVVGWPMAALGIRCTGRGTYRRTTSTAQGFPRGSLMRCKSVHGFRTGDLARAIVPAGKRIGNHQGRIAVRANGYFDVRTSHGLVQNIAHRHFRLVQRSDGYGYGY